MTLGNMRAQGVRRLAVYCLNHSCPASTEISADDYADEIEVPSFALRMKCSKCGGWRVERAAEKDDHCATGPVKFD
jgi:hypothetical protein